MVLIKVFKCVNFENSSNIKHCQTPYMNLKMILLTPSEGFMCKIELKNLRCSLGGVLKYILRGKLLKAYHTF